VSILRFIELLSGVDLLRVAEFGWQLIGAPKGVEFANRRGGAFIQHLRTKHPEWFIGPELRIPLTAQNVIRNGASYGAIMLAMFYAFRCAAKGPTCRHKP